MCRLASAARVRLSHRQEKQPVRLCVSESPALFCWLPSASQAVESGILWCGTWTRAGPVNHVGLEWAFWNISDHSEEASANHLYQQWIDLGLTDIRLSNYSVLVSLPGPSSCSVMDLDSNQCFLLNGTQCDPKTHKNSITEEHYSYAAYSAVGSLEAVVMDVQYGDLEVLTEARTAVNVTNPIALLKLGKTPLLYKLSLLAEMGFSGVLLYVDPCDSPSDQSLLHKAFGVTLNPGGDPSTPGYPSIGECTAPIL
ncbi:hypothetical protein DPEC_G00266390 [Dallia pectoralis]|uniref:Uncharacterized protein n=1 Tax=Dallia pectoralis TaxID=75939 RepID=A0ACC2FNQ4_DALPE|nr:hypothetical protein DPEC_G00266390 [Dallia pectoralis]